MRINYGDLSRRVLRPLFYFLKDLSPEAKRLMARNATLEDRFYGKRCFVLLSGEPLSYIEVGKLKNEYTAGSGFLFFAEDVRNLPLDFVIAMEPGPVMDKWHAPGWFNWPEDLVPSQGRNQGLLFLEKTKEHFTSKGTVTFLDANKIAYYKRSGFLSVDEPNVFFLKSNPYLFSSKRPKLDLTRRFTGTGGSVFNMILILIYMGFKEIYLAGAGYTYDPVYELHFYDNLVVPRSLGREKAECEAKRAVADRNQNTGSKLEYYGVWPKDDFYRVVCVTRRESDPNKDRHRLMKRYAAERGVRIYNIVPDGFGSPVYEKRTWAEVVKDVLPNPGRTTGQTRLAPC